MFGGFSDDFGMFKLYVKGMPLPRVKRGRAQGFWLRVCFRVWGLVYQPLQVGGRVRVVDKDVEHRRL